jgi:hypothetical protein
MNHHNPASRSNDTILIFFTNTHKSHSACLHTKKTGRVPLMGIRKKSQNNIIAAAASFMLIHALRKPAKRWGIDEVELSWILEDNTRMRNILETIGCSVYKTYRIYEKQLTSNTL